MGKYINPFTDFGFHRLFGDEAHKELLIDFLNQLFYGEMEIRTIQFLNPIHTPERFEERGSTFDLYCLTNDGRYVIVEMQNAWQENFKDRGLFYVARSLGKQGKKGDKWKYELCPVYGVFLMNFKTRGSKFRTDVALVDRQTGCPWSGKLRMTFLELGYFTKEADECENDFERWIYLLKHMDVLDRLPFRTRKRLFGKLFEVANVESLSDEDRFYYDEALKNYRDFTNSMEFQKKEGIEIGRKEGLKEGLKEGMEKEKYATARNLKALGVDWEIIAQATGLTLEEIRDL